MLDYVLNYMLATYRLTCIIENIPRGALLNTEFETF